MGDGRDTANGYLELKLRDVTEDYIAELGDAAGSTDPRVMAETLWARTCAVVRVHNASLPKRQVGALGWKMPSRLSEAQIASLVAARRCVRRIRTNAMSVSDDYDVLGIYCESGWRAGLYATDRSEFVSAVREFVFNVGDLQLKQIMLNLEAMAPRVPRTVDADLVPVDNGVYDREAGELLPFSPDMVFLSKSHVAYRPDAENPIIEQDDGSTWDVESWMASLSDDAEVVETLWRIVGAVIRPYVNWDKAAWFYADSGSNGKGTLCALMRNLLGPGAHTSISLEDFARDFHLEPLLSVQAVICDENNVSGYIDRSSQFKEVVTHDVIQINRKHRQPVAYQFFGFVIECLNEPPRIRDRSDSFYRRQLYIDFTKTFTGRENKRIKSDYIARTDVLEYVLGRVLSMDYDALETPRACESAFEEFKLMNDPVRQFWADVAGELAWNVVPYTFLYDLYRAWYAECVGSSGALAKQRFQHELSQVLKSTRDTHWVSDPSKQFSTARYINEPEPLIARYRLRNWMNDVYKGEDRMRRSMPSDLPKQMRGLLRVAPYEGDDEDEDDAEA